jgi:hypothetical protein
MEPREARDVGPGRPESARKAHESTKVKAHEGPRKAHEGDQKAQEAREAIEEPGGPSGPREVFAEP